MFWAPAKLLLVKNTSHSCWE